MDLDHMRTSYGRDDLTEANLGDDPLAALKRWIEDAAEDGMREPNAMALATSDAEGRASVRFVLCKGLDADGIVFYTNYESRKGRELSVQPWAAATFWWDRLERQVRLEGPTARLAPEASDAYFASRPHGSRVGAWASPQSREIHDRDELERRFAEAAERHPEGSQVPRPPAWGGVRIRPLRIEFWQGRANRTHDRIEFRRSSVDEAGWRTSRLAP